MSSYSLADATQRVWEQALQQEPLQQENVRRNIGIFPVLRGYIVEVGCTRIIYKFNETKRMLDDLEEYFDDPVKKEMQMRNSDAQIKIGGQNE